MAQLAKKCNVASEDVKNVIIWGNHSSTQFPDASHASIKGKPASELIDKAWYNFFFLSDLTFDLIKIILVNRSYTYVVENYVVVISCYLLLHCNNMKKDNQHI